MFQKHRLIYLLLIRISVDILDSSYKLIFTKKNIQMEANALWVIIEITDASSGWLQSLQRFIELLNVCH